MKKILLFAFYLLTMSINTSFANNLDISAVTLSGGNTLNFTVSWDNSWSVASAPFNHDAVWFFVKRRDCASLDWRHQDLSNVLADHIIGAPLMAVVTTDKKGIFVKRSATGTGNISSIAISIKLDNPPAGDYDYQVFGVESVFIPTSAFSLGDGNAAGTTNTFHSNGSGGAAFNVASEAAISMGSSTAGTLGSNSNNLVTCNTIALAAGYPKGFNSFYCMKYEISQGQYVDFLNNISQDAAGNRGYTGVGRNTIAGAWPVFTTTTPNRACDSLSWADLAAYLDWSALSPMTEFEFEKICRGTATPIASEFAWGSNTYTDADALVNDATSSEASSAVITPGSGLTNVDGDGTLGPIRCGYAAKSATSRFEAGASFYGVMDMSGNVAERCIAPADGNACGGASTFTNIHGDGEITNSVGGAITAGFHNATNWPSSATESDVSVRGGAWNQPAVRARTSDRAFSTDASRAAILGRKSTFGGRGVRRVVVAPSTF